MSTKKPAAKIVKLPEEITASSDYKNLVDLFAVLAEAQDQKITLQASLNQASRELIDEHRKEIVELETTITQADSAIEVICRRHPEWFEKVKTLKTPYGAASFRKSSELVAPSEDATIALIKASGRAADFIRVTEDLDREALEKLSDEELGKLGLFRKTEDKFAAKPAKVDLGKATAEAQEVAA